MNYDGFCTLGRRATDLDHKPPGARGLMYDQAKASERERETQTERLEQSHQTDHMMVIMKRTSKQRFT